VLTCGTARLFLGLAGVCVLRGWPVESRQSRLGCGGGGGGRASLVRSVPPAAHPRRAKGQRLKQVEARTLLPFVFALNGLLGFCVGRAEMNVGQAREYSFVVIASCLG
jgi:hypothetical protein